MQLLQQNWEWLNAKGACAEIPCLYNYLPRLQTRTHAGGGGRDLTEAWAI